MGQTYNEFTGGGWAGEASTDYASAGANAAGLAAWQAYQAQQEAAQNAIQAQTDALPGYSNSVDTTTAQGGLYPNFPTDPTPENIAAIGLAPVTDPASGAIIGYNPANQGTGYQSLQGYTNETPSGGGQLYAAPVAFHGGYIDFGANYNAQTDPNDYFYYSDYAQALEGGNNGTGLKGTNGTISYGSAPENQIQATSTVGTMLGGLESDPTINGIDYSQGASYANLASNGIGTPENTYTTNGNSGTKIVPYTQYTEPGYKSPAETAAAPTETQSYNAQGQIIQSAPSSASEDVTFLYGNNGSLGSLSGTLSGANGPAPQTFGSVITNGKLTTNKNPQDSTDIGTFTANEGPSAGDTGIFSALNTATINQGDSQPGLGTFSGQPGASQAPTDTAQNYFTYGANYGQIQANDLAASTASGGVNQATGGVGGYNPLGLNQTNQTTLSGTDSALGYYGQVNPITGQTLANTNQTNPALQALAASRSLQ